ncbi:MAG: A/G-specific adenine glycosylase, partial [Nitrospina sp.]|nr:A/G-specific adenine glycosylase [Nitrospina sp.]
RDLPWRRTRDPYAIWISETMLQQTRVETVVPYYERFLERFPRVSDLAEASEDDVFAHWAGLGYYRRASNLHRAARVVHAERAGEIPVEERDLLALPGIGRYTAGALRSIAFGREAPVLDGNVARVLARVFGREGELRTHEVELWELATRLVAGSRPADLNQGLMELGAVVCVPRSPRCDACPLDGVCDARRRGLSEAIPTPASRK